MFTSDANAALLSPTRQSIDYRDARQARALLQDLFDTAIAAVSAAHCLPPHLPAPPRDAPW